MDQINWIDWSGCVLVEAVRAKMHGTPVFKGTEVPAESVVDDIESGRTVEDVAEDYQLEPTDVQAVHEFYKAANAFGKFLPRVHTVIPVVTGPIWGIPADAVIAWITTPDASPKSTRRA